MWQQCSQCKGSGRNYNGLSSDSKTAVCDVCNGHKIISELTGLPPQTIRPRKYTLMQNTILGDKLQVSHNGTYEGIVTLINIKGVGLYTDDGYKFVRWCNVLSNHSR